MTELFDSYRSNYRDVVQSSIDFSGLPHSFFMRAKADLLRELIARRLGPEKPAMLDVGCGVGSFHPLLRGMVGRLSGIDVSSASIAQARADNRDVDYRAFDGRSFPFDDASFDLVTAICVLHHVAPAEWTNFISEMRRVVRPRGADLRHRAQSAQSADPPCRCALRIRPRRRLARRRQGAEVDGGRRLARDRRALFPAVALGGEARAPASRGALSNVPLGAQYAAFGTLTIPVQGAHFLADMVAGGAIGLVAIMVSGVVVRKGNFLNFRLGNWERRQQNIKPATVVLEP